VVYAWHNFTETDQLHIVDHHLFIFIEIVYLDQMQRFFYQIFDTPYKILGILLLQ